MPWLSRLRCNSQPVLYKPLLAESPSDTKSSEDDYSTVSSPAESIAQVSMPTSDTTAGTDDNGLQGLATTPPYQSLLMPLPTFCAYVESMPPTHIAPYTPNKLVVITKANLEVISANRPDIPPTIAPERWFDGKYRYPDSITGRSRIDSLVWEELRGRFPPYTVVDCTGVRRIAFYDNYGEGRGAYIGQLLDPISESSVEDGGYIYEPYGDGIGRITITGYFREFVKVHVLWENMREYPDQNSDSNFYIHRSRICTGNITDAVSTTHSIVHRTRSTISLALAGNSTPIGYTWIFRGVPSPTSVDLVTMQQRYSYIWWKSRRGNGHPEIYPHNMHARINALPTILARELVLGDWYTRYLQFHVE